MFSNLSQGSLLHILCLKDGIKYYECPVEQIMPSGKQFPNVFNMNQSLDITVSIEDKKREFSGIIANSSLSVSPDYIISDSRETITSQVQNLLKTKEDIIKNKDRYEKEIESCKRILKHLSPSFAKESAIDNAIIELTNRVNKIQDDFGGIKGDVKQVLSLLTSENTTKN